MKLETCPFCKKEVEMYTREQCGELRDIRCKTPGCFMEFGADWWLLPAELAKIWNTRVKI